KHIFNPFPWIKWVMYIAALFLPIFIISTIIRPVNKKHKLIGLYYTIVSSIVWIIAALVLYMSLYTVGVQVKLSVFIGIFVISALCVLVSFTVRVFVTCDLVSVLGLHSLNVPEEKIVLALLFYELVYYLFPVLITLILTTFEFRHTTTGYWDNSKFMVPIK